MKVNLVMINSSLESLRLYIEKCITSHLFMSSTALSNSLKNLNGILNNLKITQNDLSEIYQNISDLLKPYDGIDKTYLFYLQDPNVKLGFKYEFQTPDKVRENITAAHLNGNINVNFNSNTNTTKGLVVEFNTSYMNDAQWTEYHSGSITFVSDPNVTADVGSREKGLITHRNVVSPDTKSETTVLDVYANSKLWSFNVVYSIDGANYTQNNPLMEVNFNSNVILKPISNSTNKSRTLFFQDNVRDGYVGLRYRDDTASELNFSAGGDIGLQIISNGNLYSNFYTTVNNTLQCNTLLLHSSSDGNSKITSNFFNTPNDGYKTAINFTTPNGTFFTFADNGVAYTNYIETKGMTVKTVPLTVESTTNLNGDLNVGSTKFGSPQVNTNFHSHVKIDGVVTLTNLLNTESDINIKNDLTVTGTTTLNGINNLNGTTTISNLTATGSINLNNTTNVMGTFNVGKSDSWRGTNLYGDLTVFGASELKRTHVDGSFQVGNDTTHYDSDLHGSLNLRPSNSQNGTNYYSSSLRFFGTGGDKYGYIEGTYPYEAGGYHGLDFFPISGTSPALSIRTDKIYTTSYFEGRASSASMADVAEWYKGDQKYEPGTVLAYSHNDTNDEHYTIFNGFSDIYFGVVSTDPGCILNNGLESHPAANLVALKGMVPVKVIGKVLKKGAPVYTSNIEGIATVDKTDDRQEMIGRALETNIESGVKMVLCKV